MDESERLELQQASGTAAAALALQGAIMAHLVANSLVTLEDMTVISADASAGLATLTTLSPESREFARLTISGLVRAMTKRLQLQ